MNLTRTLAVLAGLAWTIGVAAIGTQANTDPVGAHYDTINRYFTFALLLILAFAIRVAPRLPGVGGVALILTAIAWIAGNVLEFWAVLATDLHTEKTADRLGESEAWWGSQVGWMIFMVGFITTMIAAVSLAASQRSVAAWATVPLAVIGTAATALWAVSPLAAATAGLGLGLWLIWVANVERTGGQVETSATGRGFSG
jgi:hypothetical protein